MEVAIINKSLYQKQSTGMEIVTTVNVTDKRTTVNVTDQKKKKTQLMCHKRKYQLL